MRNQKEKLTFSRSLSSRRFQALPPRLRLPRFGAIPGPWALNYARPDPQPLSVGGDGGGEGGGDGGGGEGLHW